jgi:hypothetical protein
MRREEKMNEMRREEEMKQMRMEEEMQEMRRKEEKKEMRRNEEGEEKGRKKGGRREEGGGVKRWEDKGGVKGMLEERYEYCVYVLLSHSFTKRRGKINEKTHFSNRSQTYLETNLVETKVIVSIHRLTATSGWF